MNSGITVFITHLFPCTTSRVALRVYYANKLEKKEKNGYKSLAALSSTTIPSFHIHNDDNNDDGRRSSVRAYTHSTCIDEMFIFTSSECKYFVYTYSHCTKEH